MAEIPELWPFQQEAVIKVLKRGGRAGLFLEMGTGKTRTAIVSMKKLRARRVLVVVPLSAAGIWRREIRTMWPNAKILMLVRTSIVNRRNRLREVIAARVPEERPVFVIVNYEAYWREPLRKEIIRWLGEYSKRAGIIYDEAHRLKHRGSKQSRFAHRLAEVDDKTGKLRSNYRLALTGSPMTHGPEDLFSIYRAVESSVFGHHWADFHMRYIIMGGYLGKQIVGYMNREEIERKLIDTAFRITKAEALDLPEEQDVIVPVTLGARAQKVYDDMADKAIAEIEGWHSKTREERKGTALSRIVLTNILRLQQITSGFIKIVEDDTGAATIDDDDAIVDISSEKIDTLRDLLSDLVEEAGRVVVFARFTHDIDRIKEAAESVSRHVAVLDGRVPQEDRDNIIEAWRNASVGILIGQISVTALALDFTAAHVAVFYSLDFDLTHYIQSRARLHRAGQRHPVTYYHLIVENSIDAEIYKTLEAREEMARGYLDTNRAKNLFRRTPPPTADEATDDFSA